MTTTTINETIDQERADAFVGKGMEDLGATMTVILAAIGDRLGLYHELANSGPATSAELAERTGIAERYAREWLAQQGAFGYLSYDPTTSRYDLPPEHVPVLADEGGPVFFGGAYHQLRGIFTIVEDLIEAFQSGGGVAADEYPDWYSAGIERFTAGWFDNLLLPEWLPAMPVVTRLLDDGADVADVGCGRGRALITLAQAHPSSRYVGYDVHGPSIEGARRAAEEAGVSDRVRFEQRDVVAGLPTSFDVVFTFDVVHDAVDPAGLLAAIREGLQPDGRYVCVDINASPRPEENAGPLGALFYGFSVLYCMTTSLAEGGDGLGTCGFNPEVVERMCAEAGFSDVHLLDLENPFNNVYEITP